MRLEEALMFRQIGEFLDSALLVTKSRIVLEIAKELRDPS